MDHSIERAEPLFPGNGAGHAGLYLVSLDVGSEMREADQLRDSQEKG